MFCKICGATLPDGTKFCTKCGSKIVDEPAVNPGFNMPQQSFAPQQPMMESVPYGGAVAVQAPPKKKSVAKIVVPIVAVFLVFALSLGAYFTFFAEYKKPANDYFKAIETQDADMMEKCLPKFMKDMIGKMSALGGGNGGNVYAEFVKGQHAYFASWVDNAEDIKISYKVISEKEESKEDLDEEIAQLKALGINVEIEKAYELELEVTVKGGGKEETKTVKAAAFKEDGKWTVFVDGGGSGMF